MSFPALALHSLSKRFGSTVAAEMLGHTSSDITRAHYIEPDERVNPVTAEILETLAPRRVDHRTD